MNQQFLTECPMCFELYDENQRIPRNLLCGHTFCELCLSRIYQDRNQIICPTCRTQHDVTMKPNLLSKNYIAQDLASKEAQYKNKYEYCDKHQEPLQFYCEDDKQSICSDCIVEHPGHKFQKIKYSIPILMGQLETLATNITDKIDNANKQKEDLVNIQKSVIKDMKKSQDQVESEFEKIFKALEDKKSKIYQQIEDFYTKQQEDLNFEIVLQESIATDQKSQLEKLEKLQSEIKNVSFLSDDTLVNQIKEAEKQIDQKEKEQQNNKSNEVMPNDIPPRIDIDIQPVFAEIQSLGTFQKIINGRICYMGEKNKVLIYDIGKNEWILKHLKITPYFELYYYSSAVTLPSGDILVTGGGVSNKVFQLCANRNFIIQQKTPMLEPRKEHASIIIGKQVYVFGGYNNKEKKMLSTCEVYDIEFDLWKSLPPMNSPKCAIAIAQLNEKEIFIIGGFDGSTRLKTIEKYNIQTKEWQVLDIKLEQALSNAAAYGINSNQIMIIGGGNDDGFSEQTILYDSNTNEMKYIAPMSEGRDLRNKLVRYNGELYAIGGHNKSGSKFNLVKQSWEHIPSYSTLLQDHLDSWSCAISYQFENDKEENSSFIQPASFQNLDIFNQQQQQQQQQLQLQQQSSQEQPPMNMNGILNQQPQQQPYNRYHQQQNDNVILNNTNPIISYNNPNPYGFLYQPSQSRQMDRQVNERYNDIQYAYDQDVEDSDDNF